MANKNVSLLLLKSKFDEKSAKETANQAKKSFDKSLKDVGDINISDKLADQLDNAVGIITGKLKKVNTSSYSNDLLETLVSKKSIGEKTKAIENFIEIVGYLNNAITGNEKALNLLGTQQLNAIIRKEKQIVQLQSDKVKKEETSRMEAIKLAKPSRSVSQIEETYSKSDYSNKSKKLKKAFFDENETFNAVFNDEQKKSIESLAQMLGLYQAMQDIKPSIGSKENVTYTKDLLTLVKEIKTTNEQIDLFSDGTASKLVSGIVDKRYLNTNLTNIDESDILLNAINKYSKNNESVTSVQKNIDKIQKQQNDYIADVINKALTKTTVDAEEAVSKAQKKSSKLQDKLGTPGNNGNQNNADSIVSADNTDILTLDEIEKRLTRINKLDEQGNASDKRLKEYISLYKQYLELIKSTPGKNVNNVLQEEYDAILSYSPEFKQYADQLDNSRTEQLLEQENQVKQTVIAEEKLIETEKEFGGVNQENKKTIYTVDTEEALTTIEQIKTRINEIPDEKNIKINVQNVDYNNVPLLSDEEGKVVTAFRGVKDAWSGLINDKGIAFFTDNLKLAADYADSLAKDGKVYQANLSFHNPLEINGNGAVWDKIEFNGIERKTKEIVEIAQQLGYDGVIFKNIRDGFGEANGEISNVLVALDVAQIKNEKVIGTVKAGTGEFIDISNKIDNSTSKVSNSNIEQQNKIQEELKETQKVAKQTSEAINSVGTDKPNTSLVSPGMKNISSATEQATQSKKDFASANEEVQSSVDGSKSKLELEADLMQSIADNAQKAADAKKEFAEANSKVSDSAKETSKQLDNEANKISEVKKKLRQDEKRSEQSAVNKALNDQYNAYKKIQDIREKIARASSSEEIKALKDSKKIYQEQIIAANRILKSHSDLYDKEAQTAKLEKVRLETNAKIAKYKNSESKKADKRQVKVDSMISGLGKYEGNLKNYQNRIDSGSANEPFIKKFNDYSTAYTNYAAAIKNAQNLRENNKLVPDEEINNLEKLKTALDEAEQSIKSLSKTDTGSSSISRNKLIVQMNDYLKKNSGMSKEFKAELNDIIAQVKKLGASADVSDFANQFLKLKVNIHDAGQEGKSFLDIIKNKAMYGLAAQIGMYFGFNDIIRYIREGITVAKEYDDALTNISYTMDLTKSQLDDLGSSVLDLASNMKASISDAMQVAQIYANMNTTAEEIQKLSQPTLILSNLTGFDAETVANDIQAVNQQFEIAAEDSMQIADIYDYISRNIAISYSKGIEGMAAGVQIVGSTAKQAGLDFAKTASIIAKAMEKTRLDGEQVANGLKTILVRTSKVGKLSDEVDNETLSNASESLHKIGIEVYNLDGSYRQFDVIMSELANKWDSLTDAEKSNISFQIAATRQTNLLAAILSNFSDSMDLAKEATNANGSALENQQKYMESYSGKLQDLETQAKIAWINILDSDALKNGISLLTTLVKVVSELVDKFGLLPTVATIGGGILGAKSMS